MELFWETSETVPAGAGFRYYDAEHIFCLSISLVVVISVCYIYHILSDSKRTAMRMLLLILIFAAELFKQISLFLLGQWNIGYLPFHLCSVNMFLILWHAIRPNPLLDNYLYAVCIPAAIAALLFPGWNDLPLWNYISVHSWILHILLICYPLALTIKGDMKPEFKEAWKVLIFLLGLTVFFFFFDEYLHRIGIEVNFFFLRWVPADNPVYVFKTLWGSHLYGLLLIAVMAILLMYTLLYLIRKIANLKNRKS